jgi:hypothetical protein
MLPETILEIVGVSDIVGAVSALENVDPEGHCRRLVHQFVRPLPVRAHPSTSSG